MGIVSPEELERYLAPDPPTLILLGYESKGEDALADYAQAHGYTGHSVGEEGVMLWSRPDRPPP